MNGFKIEIALDQVERSGISAIDFCRTLALEERAIVETSSWARSFSVSDEGFIRAWFGRDSCSEYARVSPDWLKPRELTINDQGYIVLSEVLTVERAKELFVRSRFRTLEKKLAAIQEEPEESSDDE